MLALLPPNLHYCNADLFVVTETLLSDNDSVCNLQCDEFTCLQAIYSCPERAREIKGTLLPFIFLTALLGMTHTIIIK